ncbi:hypothetical protein [Breoghania sp.]|uniref:hypothetical protein n=1 Tax=Breoghania sp. TaxID=2065378 RepID=UPI002AA8FA95|nr:hypothetical protein [Breoghania sp.]
MAAKKTAEAEVRLSLVDKVTGPIRRIKARFAALGNRLGVDRLTKSLRGVTSAVGGLGAAVGRSLGRVSALVGLLGVGAGGAAFAAFRLAQQTAQTGDAVGKLARQVGIGVESLQEWQYVAELSGVSQSELTTAVEAFNRRAGEAAAGNKAMAKGFAAAGVSIRDAGGNIKSTEVLFGEVITAMTKMKDPSKKAATAMALFGRSGMRLARMADAGTDGIKAMREEARRLGFVLGEDVTKASEEFNDNVSRLMRVIEGLKNTVGAALLPIMNEVVVNIKEWATANRELIAGKVKEWVERVSRVVRDLMDPTSEIRVAISDLAAGFSSFMEKLRPVVDFLGGPMNSAFVALGAWVAGPIIAGLGALTGAFVSLGVAIMATPIGWILGGIALLAGAVSLIIDNWDVISEWWSGIWNDMQETVQGVLDWFTGGGVLSAMSELLDTIKKPFADAIDWFLDLGGAIVDAIVDGISAKWDSLSSWFSEKIRSLVPDWAPDWLKESLGFSGASGVAAPAPNIVPKAANSNERGASTTGASSSAAGGAAIAGDVSTPVIEAQTLKIPEPLIANQPKNVDASFNVASIVVDVSGMTRQEAEALLNSTLRKQAARHEAETRAALND